MLSLHPVSIYITRLPAQARKALANRHGRDFFRKQARVNPGHLIIITAPSGAGKTSLINALLRDDDNLLFSVSHTTRPPRTSEQHGADYHFVAEAAFMAMLKAGDFLEHAVVYGYHYGTSRRWVDEQLAQGHDVILELDWQGAAQIRKLAPQACSVFILPPTLQALTQRLQGRGQDHQDTIDKRMKEARDVIEHVRDADFVVVNDDFDTAVDDLRAILRCRRLSTASQKQKLAPLLNGLLEDHSGG